MLKKEHEILKPLVERPWKKFTFGEVKAASGKKSESYTYNSLKRFVKAGVLREEKAGNVILYSLAPDSLKAHAYAGMAAEHLALSKKHLPYEALNGMAMKIPTSFYILLVTGSYARNEQTSKSDIDAVVICDDSFEPKRIYAELKQYCELNIPAIHLYVFRKSEFEEMLLNGHANYGKEVARNNLILIGGEEYFRIVLEAVKNGFDG